MLNGVGLGANQTGRKRSRAGRPLHTYVALLNPASYKSASDVHVYVLLCKGRGPLHTCIGLQSCSPRSELCYHMSALQ